MSVVLTVNGLPFNYPTAGESPGWGESATDWAVSVTDTLNGLINPGDILSSLFTISNSQTGSFAPITGMIFNSATTIGSIIFYSVSRKTSNPGAEEAVETGELRVIYRPNSATWDLSQSFMGDGKIEFEITSAGQVRYKVVALGGASYSGKIRFRAFGLQS